MAQILRLGKARKARRVAAERAQADENAVRHGRTREQREREAAAQRRAVEQLDGARLEPFAPTPVPDDETAE